MSNSASARGGYTFTAAKITLILTAILFIFVSIANFTLHQVVPRHLRFVVVTTEGLGAAILGSRNPLDAYGNADSPKNVRSPGDGLRLYYTWGLWNRCAGYYGKSKPQYCTDTAWAYKFQPRKAILEDLPSNLGSQASTLFNDRYSSDDYFGDWSRVAFYFIFICASLTAIALILSLANVRGPGRLASLSLAILSLLAFISGAVGTIIWTAIAGILRHQLGNNYSTLGMSAQYGNAIWLMWAIDLLLLLTTFSFLGSCILGRRRSAIV